MKTLDSHIFHGNPMEFYGNLKKFMGFPNNTWEIPRVFEIFKLVLFQLMLFVYLSFKENEFLDKTSKSLDILSLFFEPWGSPISEDY